MSSKEMMKTKNGLATNSKLVIEHSIIKLRPIFKADQTTAHTLKIPLHECLSIMKRENDIDKIC